jgi:hypothetical protein
MRGLGLATGAATLITIQALATGVVAADARFEKSLQQLDPAERLEQLCDYTAMLEIRKGAGQYRPDRAVANAMADAHVSDDTVKATAGAFRSRGKWYTLAFSCTATPDHLKVVSFHYTIGPEIPETKWAAFGLWD